MAASVTYNGWVSEGLEGAGNTPKGYSITFTASESDASWAVATTPKIGGALMGFDVVEGSTAPDTYDVTVAANGNTRLASGTMTEGAYVHDYDGAKPVAGEAAVTIGGSNTVNSAELTVILYFV